MSSSKKAAEFGWPGGDRPGELAFQFPVPDDIRHILLGCIRTAVANVPDDAPLLALTLPQGIVSRYMLVVPGGNWFVRVSAKILQPMLEQAVTGWLKSHGVSVNHVEIAGLTVRHEGRTYRVDLREIVNARHFDGSLRDLEGVSRELAKCHAAFRGFPGEWQVRRYSASRFGRLEAVGRSLHEGLTSGTWHRICQDADWAASRHAWFARMAKHWVPRLDLLPGAQCLHAQMHQANVLFRLDDQQPVLVDLEEAVQTFAPASWDMAYFVQRFCMADKPAENVLRDRLATIRKAYGQPVTGLAAMMQQTSWLSMAVLMDYFRQGIISPLSEYEKFVRLETQAREMAWLLEEYFE